MKKYIALLLVLCVYVSSFTFAENRIYFLDHTCAVVDEGAKAEEMEEQENEIFGESIKMVVGKKKLLDNLHTLTFRFFKYPHYLEEGEEAPGILQASEFLSHYAVSQQTIIRFMDHGLNVDKFYSHIMYGKYVDKETSNGQFAFCMIYHANNYYCVYLTISDCELDETARKEAYQEMIKMLTLGIE